MQKTNIPKVATLAINVKGADLLFLDHIDDVELEAHDHKMWVKAGVDVQQRPFGRVIVYTPLQEDGLNRNSLRNNPAADIPGYSQTREFTLGIRDLWPYLDLFFDDRSMGMTLLLAEIEEYFLKTSGSSGFTLADVINLFNTKINIPKSARDDTWKDFYASTIQSVSQRFRSLPATLGGLIDVTGTGFGLDTLTDLQPYDMVVVDIERILANPRDPEVAESAIKIITAYILKRLTEAMTRGNCHVEHIIVFADELNRLAPHDRKSGIGEYLAQLARTTRDRGIVLFGAGQFRSGINEDLLKAASVHYSMQTPEHELGDLFHKSTPYPRAIRCATWMVKTLIKHEIEVVIIDGNHETSNSPHPGSPTTFLQELGARVVNGAQYEVIRDGDWQISHLLERERLAVHLLPCRVVREKAFTGVSPIPGYINVLVAHGRVQGMYDLISPRFREAGIPQDILRHAWDYIALGDWHTHRYQPLEDVPAYYAGSPEALNFAEAMYHPPSANEPHRVRGAIDVRLSLGDTALVSTLPNTERRPVLRLRQIEAAGLDADTLMDKLRQRLDSQMPAEALALLEVKDCPVRTWEQLDHQEIDQLRQLVRRCEIRWTLKQPPELEHSAEAISQASLDNQWQQFLERIISDDVEREQYVNSGLRRIEDARQQLAAASFQAGEERE